MDDPLGKPEHWTIFNIPSWNTHFYTNPSSVTHNKSMARNSEFERQKVDFASINYINPKKAKRAIKSSHRNGGH